MIGVSTIGNATLIAYDSKTVLATATWFGDTDPAYFGSWVASLVFPENLKQDVFNSEYILSITFGYDLSNRIYLSFGWSQVRSTKLFTNLEFTGE